MKKWLILVLLLSLGSSLMMVGCGGSNKDHDDGIIYPPEDPTDFYHFEAASELLDFTPVASTITLDTINNHSGTTVGSMRITPDSGVTEVKLSFLKTADLLLPNDFHLYVNKSVGGSNIGSIILFIIDETASGTTVAAKGVDVASLPLGWNKVLIPINTAQSGIDQWVSGDIVAGHTYKLEFCLNYSSELTGTILIDDIGLED